MIRRLLFAFALCLGVSPALANNYSATAGSGLTFGALLNAGVLYPFGIMCDPTTPTQCMAVNASGQITAVIASGTVSATGSTSNASSAVATSSTNVPVVGWLYGFNGTTWDQLQVDGSKFLKVNIAAGGGFTQPVSVASGQIVNGASVAQGSTTDAPCSLPASATACSQVAIEKAIANAANAPPPLGTSGGWTPVRLSALGTTVTSIKSSAAGQLGLLQCGNTNASEGYVQLFDVATAGGVTLGTTTPTLSIPIAATNTGGFAMPLVGMQFSNGLQAAATTTATGSTALGTALDCNALRN